MEMQLGSFLLEVRYTSTRIFKYYTMNLCRFELDGPHKQHSFRGISSNIARDFLFACMDCFFILKTVSFLQIKTYSEINSASSSVMNILHLYHVYRPLEGITATTVGNDQEKEQSGKDSHSKTEVGKKLN